MSFDPNNYSFRNTALAAALIGGVLLAGCSSGSKHVAPKTSQSSSPEATSSTSGDTHYPFSGKSSKGELTIHADGTGDFISKNKKTDAVRFSIVDITCQMDGSIKTGYADFIGEDRHFDSLSLSAEKTKQDDFCENGHLGGKALTDPFALGYAIGQHLPS